MPPPILIAEDDENDVILLKRAFAKAKIVNPLVFVNNGEEVIQYLSGMGGKGQGEPQMPGLLMLDIKMPKMGGLDVLRWIRSHKPFNRLITVIFSSSSEKKDIDAAYDLHANSYLTKPASFQKTVDLIISVHNYWFCWNEKPECIAGPVPLPDLKTPKSEQRSRLS